MMKKIKTRVKQRFISRYKRLAKKDEKVFRLRALARLELRRYSYFSISFINKAKNEKVFNAVVNSLL